MYRHGLEPKSCTWVNILEEKMESEPAVKLTQENGKAVIDLDFKGFEIKTLRIDL